MLDHQPSLSVFCGHSDIPNANIGLSTNTLPASPSPQRYLSSYIEQSLHAGLHHGTNLYELRLHRGTTRSLADFLLAKKAFMILYNTAIGLIV